MWSWLDHDDEDEDDGVVVVVGRPAEPSKTTMAMAKRWCPVKQQPALSSRWKNLCPWSDNHDDDAKLRWGEEELSWSSLGRCTYYILTYNVASLTATRRWLWFRVALDIGVNYSPLSSSFKNVKKSEFLYSQSPFAPTNSRVAINNILVLGRVVLWLSSSSYDSLLLYSISLQI